MPLHSCLFSARKEFGENVTWELKVYIVYNKRVMIRLLVTESPTAHLTHALPGSFYYFVSFDKLKCQRDVTAHKHRHDASMMMAGLSE
jgi:hypothetical protein